MTLHDIIKQLVQFNQERDWTKFHTPKNLAIQVSAEAAELQGAFDTPGPVTAAIEEMADVLNCVLLLANSLNLDMGEYLPDVQRSGSHAYTHAKEIVYQAGKLMEVFMWLTPEESAALKEKESTKVHGILQRILKDLASIARYLEINPYEEALNKIIKNGQKYPVQLARGRADKYTAYE